MLPPLLWFLLAVCAAPLLLKLTIQWVAAPLLVWSKRSLAARLTVEPTRADQLTPELRDFLGQAVRQFAAEGFEVACNAFSSGAVAGVQSVNVLLVQRGTGDLASIIGTLTAGDRRAMVLAVRSQFDDGARLSTVTSASPAIFPPNPSDDSVNVSWARDASTLCELHRRRLAAKGWGDRPRFALAPGGGVNFLRREWEQEMARYARAGYLRPARNGETFRYTLKGACLVAWRLTEPLKSRRRKSRERHARRVWHEMGMDGWSAPAAEPAPAVAAIATPAAARPGPPPLIGPPPHVAPPPLMGPPPLVSPPLAGPGIGYETGLAEGEIRHEWAAGELTIRAGAQTAGQYLARRWYTLIWPALLLLLIGESVWAMWRWNAWAALVPAGRMPRQAVPGAMLVIQTGLLTLGVFRLARKLRRARGTVVLTASPAGLAFQNAPAATPAGRLRRDEIEAMRVILTEAGFFRRTYRLDVLTHGSPRPQPLVTGPDKAALEAVRTSLAYAMGIQPPPPLKDPVTRVFNP